MIITYHMIFFTDHMPEYHVGLKKATGYSIVAIITFVSVVYFGLIIYPISKSLIEACKDKIDAYQQKQRSLEIDEMCRMKLHNMSRAFDAARVAVTRNRGIIARNPDLA